MSFVHTTTQATKLMKEHAQELASGAEPRRWKGHLPRFPITAAIARGIFPLDVESHEFDPQTYFRHPANLDLQVEWPEHPDGFWMMHTNSLGLREDGEVAVAKPDLRILVAGDSHTEGACNNSETFPHVLARLLCGAHAGKTIEGINAAKGSYTFYSYLGTLEKFLDLRPDVFVVAVYGSNDFEEVLTPYHYFSGTVRPAGAESYMPAIEETLKVSQNWASQDGLSLKYFQEHPEQVEVALRAAREATLDIQETCKEHGIALLYVYIPGRFDGEGRDYICDPVRAHPVLDLYTAPGIRAESLGIHNKMGDALIAFLGERGIPCVDVRKLFEGRRGPFYWNLDHHMNVTTHRLIAEALVPWIEQTCAQALR